VQELPRFWDGLRMRDRYGVGPNSGNCLHATQIALSICDYYEIKAQPMFGVFMALNKKGYRCFKNNTPPDQWPPAAWSVGVMLEEPTEHTIGGHAFVAAEQDGEDYIIDLAADHAARPSKGINIGPLALPVSEAIEVINWAQAGVTYVWRIGQTYVAYSGGTSEWTPPWEWDTVPNGYQLERNQPEIDDMIRAIDAELQPQEHEG